MASGTILVVDDEKAQLEALSGFLKKQGYRVEQNISPVKALQIVRENPVDLVLTDYRMPEMNGVEFLKRVKAINPEIAVIVMTAFGSVESAIQAMKEGASDYLQKPVDLEEVELLVQRNLQQRRLVEENRLLKEELREKYQFKEIISASPKMESVLNIAGRVARSRASVLIRGESGTGKELVARAIHFASDRATRPFVAVNMAALPESLIESELFGHEKGAFTGAHAQRKGRIELADGGTLFIDEVGDVPLSVQVKLLRFLQEQQFERLGGSTTLSVDVRIIAATNRNLEEMIQAGDFREDLFYRLNVVTLVLPPLRERREDIPLLVDHFIRKYAEFNGKRITGISKEAMDRLMKYAYPGNIRELENIIHQAVVLAREEILLSEDLPIHLSQIREGPSQTPSPEGNTLPEKVARLEVSLIQDALKNTNGNQSQAARLLGITERNLRYKMDKYGLKPKQET
ncbi:MAG: sigma-54-dependent Fis family transcriptional regulator [Calditrichaeota bacterium]|nr:sigma-54-dependent Fis family transcriptional regulator [Calditrichota bacterium]